MNVLTTQVSLSIPRITAMEFGDLNLSLIPKVLYHIQKAIMTPPQTNNKLEFVVAVDRYLVDLLDYIVPVPVVGKELTHSISS